MTGFFRKAKSLKGPEKQFSDTKDRFTAAFFFFNAALWMQEAHAVGQKHLLWCSSETNNCLWKKLTYQPNAMENSPYVGYSSQQIAFTYAPQIAVLDNVSEQYQVSW